ncbi:MAG: flagellar assembly protein FliH [Halieaceae bacterium]|jgi:flagellar assembly protein FliH
MSDPHGGVERWQAPFFEQPAAPLPASAELEAEAQARGFALGKQQGLMAGKAEAKEVIGHLTALVEAMERPYKNLDQLVTKGFVRMAMLVAKNILRRELSINSSVVTDVMAEAIAALSKLEGDIEVVLNPADVALIEKMAPQSLQGKSWKLIEDADLLPGGCRIKTPISFVDATVESRTEQILEGLLASCESSQDS